MKYIKTYNESREELTSEEGKEFLDIVRQKLPEKVNRYMSLIVNKGLDASKKDFELNDPDEVKRKKKIEDRIFLQKKKKNKLTDYEFDILIDKYIKTEDWKEWIKKCGYPDIGNFPIFKSKISLKKDEYEIEYKNNDQFFSFLKFKILKFNDKIEINCNYSVKLYQYSNYQCYFLTFNLEKEYDSINLEESIIIFLEKFKEEVYEKNGLTKIDVEDIKNFEIKLKNESYITSMSSSEFLDIFKLKFNNILTFQKEFSFLMKIPLSSVYYDGNYIYIRILENNVFKFHEQYAHKVYKIYTKLKAS